MAGLPPKESKGAELSDDGRYRYLLWRTWAPGARLGFVMLNPSTADAAADDPTIRRCIGFAKREGFGGITVANMYAWRATDPRELRTAADPFGPGNRSALKRLCESHGTVVAAWGPKYPMTHRRRWYAETNAPYPGDLSGLVRILAERYGTSLVCLGVAKDGSPRHPLMVRADQPLVSWPVASSGVE